MWIGIRTDPPPSPQIRNKQIQKPPEYRVLS